MNKRSGINILTQRVKILLLCLFALTLQTLTALAGKTDHIYEENKNQAPRGIWSEVAVGNSLPSSFRQRHENRISQPKLLFPIFDTLCSSGRPLRILQLGDSHVAGKEFPKALRSSLEKAWGTAFNDSLGTGVHFSYLAKNGATAIKFLTPERLKQIIAKRPDLIVFSFGTNECHGMGYREKDHEKELHTTLAVLKEHCPQAIILLSTPPGDYLTQRKRYYTTSKQTGKQYTHYKYTRIPNPMSARCANVIEKFGTAQHLPVWNLNYITGGDYAPRNWQAAKKMKPDQIHYMPAGYQIQGFLFAEALLAAYNDYIKQRFNVTPITLSKSPMTK